MEAWQLLALVGGVIILVTILSALTATGTITCAFVPP